MGVAEQRIRAVEKRIARDIYETAIVFDKDGNIVYEKTGSENEVAFTLKELSKYQGHIFTHNHTYDKNSECFGVESTSSFSSDDLIIAYQQELQEMRMVIGNELHLFRWNNPEKHIVNRFFTEMEELEQAPNLLIETATEKLNAAFTAYDNDPSPLNDANAEKATIAYYEALKAQADKMNEFISNNQHIGYTFRKERTQ